MLHSRHMDWMLKMGNDSHVNDLRVFMSSRQMHNCRVGCVRSTIQFNANITPYPFNLSLITDNRLWVMQGEYDMNAVAT